LSLPCSVSLTPAQQGRVIDFIQGISRAAGSGTGRNRAP
jgi:hypothetical protein